MKVTAEINARKAGPMEPLRIRRFVGVTFKTLLSKSQDEERSCDRRTAAGFNDGDEAARFIAIDSIHFSWYRKFTVREAVKVQNGEPINDAPY